MIESFEKETPLWWVNKAAVLCREVLDPAQRNPYMVAQLAASALRSAGLPNSTIIAMIHVAIGHQYSWTERMVNEWLKSGKCES